MFRTQSIVKVIAFIDVYAVPKLILIVSFDTVTGVVSIGISTDLIVSAVVKPVRTFVFVNTVSFL